MFLKWRALVLLWLAVVAAVAADDAPEVSKEEQHDLVAEASQTAPQAQNRDGLSNSYGEPLPPDAYGPPRDINDSPLPAPVYGVPETIFLDTPPGAYGPPAPVVFPNQNYEGPPPPVKPKPIYGPPKFHPPKPSYGLPKLSYGPPKKIYGPPKQSLPKPNYGLPFKAPKISYPKPVYGPPKPVYGPPKPIYGPPKISYGTPLDVQNIQFPLTLSQNFGTIGIGPDVGSTFSTVETSIGTNFGSSFDLPPIYGTPFPNLPVNLKPNFPIPSDSYGPPGLPLGPNDQVVVQDIGSIGHYGPPQPDPNPRPPHPGIPAPPTPPHVLYDGWRPIPGVSKPLESFDQIQGHLGHQSQAHLELDQYGPPPPPPPVIQSLEQSLPNLEHQFSGAQISSGYSTVHQDALSDIDLNALVGGDSNHIDQSKTVFEAHYTEKHPQDLQFHQNKPANVYGLPEPISFVTPRQQGAKGLIPPSGIYGVPPGNQYGVPPRPANLPIPYGAVSGGGHSHGVNVPRHPIKFRESVPEGLIQQIGQISQHKDHHSIDHLKSGPAYLPPPIREVKDINHQTGNLGINNLALAIEPTNLYSLPHAGSPLTFQAPGNLYGSPVDSYSVPLNTVADHTASGSSANAVTASLDGTILANLSNLEAAAILKHCPYHEAILKAAQSGEKIPADLASKYVASLSSLGSTLLKNKQASQSFKTPETFTKEFSSASQTVQTVYPSNQIGSEKTIRSTIQNGKSLKDEFKQNSLQHVSDQIYRTSEKIKNLSEQTRKLQQKIASTSQNISPTENKSFAVQIQSSDGKKPTIPHEQLLSEGLLQSILQAIEQPQRKDFQNYQPVNHGGLVLPDGYEPVDRTKNKDLEVQSSNEVAVKVPIKKDCDLKADTSIRHEVIVAPPGVSSAKVEDVDNDVAIYFDKADTVTEISVATSISEDRESKS